MNQPLVSIVISTLNPLHRSRDIHATLDNIAKQDYANVEVIVINDGSTDDTAKTLAARSDIILINNPECLGLQKSLNIGCKLAKGKYIARIDDHDLWIDQSKLSKQIALLEANSNLGVVGTAFTIGSRTFVNPLTDRDIRRQMLFRCPFSHVTVVFRKDVFNRVGGYDESLKYSEDWDLWLRIGMIAQMANLADVTTAVEESTPGSLTDTFYVSQWHLNQVLLRKYRAGYPRRYLASLYHAFVGIFFRLVKKDSGIHRFFTKVYTWVFAR